MQKVIIFFAFALCCSTSLGQTPTAVVYFNSLQKGDNVEWIGKNQKFEIIQVVDSENAILKLIPYSMWGAMENLMPEQYRIKFWYEGPTNSMVDGAAIYDIGNVRFQGTKTYTTVLGGSSTINHVKHFSKAELKATPGALSLTLRNGISAVVRIKSKKGSRYILENLENNKEVKITLSMLDKDSKKLVKAWNPIGEFPSEKQDKPEKQSPSPLAE